MKFKVAVTWSMFGEYAVEANTLEEAIDKVLEPEEAYSDLPSGHYVDDSMQVDMDTTRELNGIEE